MADERRLRKIAIGLFLLTGIVGLILGYGTAHAHESYTGRNDPVTNLGCCGGGDCAPVPLDVDWVQPVPEGYRVTLTGEQASTFNKNATHSIDVIVPYSRVMSIATSAVKYTGPPAFYHICIVSNELRCLFAVPGT